MASPFSVFRKHQKAMLAVVGILCMVAFTILPIFLDQGSQTTGGKNPIVATTADGPIHELDLREMQSTRILANGFMAGAFEAAYGQQAGLAAYVMGGRDYNSYFGPPSEQSVVETNLLAQRARELGIVISDSAINDFLRQMTGDRVKADSFRQIVAVMNAAIPQVFDALRTELAVQRLREMMFANVHATPGERWDYYKRLKQRATVEVLGVRVEDFLDQVPNPSGNTLREFFEAHKNAEPVPGSPTPGFKVPAKAAFQYFRADYNKFFNEATVTDEEIQQHYEKNKERYPYTPGSLEETAAGEGKDPAAAGTQIEAEAPPPAAAGETSADDQPPAEPEEGAPEGKETPPAQPKAAGDNSSSPEPDTQQPADQDGEKDEDQAGRVRPPVFRTVGYRRGASQDEAVEDDVQSVDSQQRSTDAPATGAPSADKPAVQVPASPPPLISDEWLLERDIEKGPNPKYDPLWKVADQIRKELASQEVAEKIEQVFDELRQEMDRFERRWASWSINRKGREPAALDFAALAAAHGLTAHETSLISAFEVTQLYPDLAEAQAPGTSGAGFLQVAFGGLPVYHSAVVEDSDGNRYLFWKSEEQKEDVPELGEVRKQVVRAWKMIQAREPALTKARELAARARRSKKSLAELFGSEQVIQAGPFSWMTVGTGAAAMRNPEPALSEVEGVIDVGHDFMREVFDLQPGEVGQAFNQPQTVAYVVRATKLEPELSFLRNLFMLDQYRTYDAVSIDDQRQIFEAWLNNVREEAQLSWVRPPDQRQ